jgi:hypothetical protein
VPARAKGVLFLVLEGTEDEGNVIVSVTDEAAGFFPGCDAKNSDRGMSCLFHDWNASEWHPE